MRGVGLNEAGFWGGGGGGFGGVVEVDRAVGGAGEDLLGGGEVQWWVKRDGEGRGGWNTYCPEREL